MKNPAIDKLRLDGGALCLDFVNTVPDRKDGTDRDLLQSWQDVLYWARKAKVIDSASLSALEKTATDKERPAREFFSESIQLRSLLYNLFYPISHEQRVKQPDLDAFNRIMAKFSGHLVLATAQKGFTQRWQFESGHFNTVVAPIVKSAQDLLLSDRLYRVKECPNCGWLFLDGTKNGKRRWCSMEECGSQVKALEYYYRKKGEASTN
jgi:predicted RNA-binding Zn ribbon-like protein